jgi:hypothetical protein
LIVSSPQSGVPFKVRVEPKRLAVPVLLDDIDVQLLQVEAVVPAAFGALEPVHT